MAIVKSSGTTSEIDGTWLSYEKLSIITLLIYYALAA